MGAFQFSGFSFGTVGANGGGARPMGAPPINSFIVWRGNKVHSNGGFSLASDVDMTPGDFRGSEAAAQPFTSEVLLDYIIQPLVELYGGAEGLVTSEVLLEGNTVHDSAVPFARGSGVTAVGGLLLRGNSFADEAVP